MADSTEHQELLLLYQITVNDLAYFKSQQWSVANHCFLLFAALAGASRLLGDTITNFDLAAITILVFAIALVGLLVIWKLQRSIHVREARLVAARNQLSEVFKKAWSAKEKGESVIKVVWFLYLALIIGPLIVCRIIYV